MALYEVKIEYILVAQVEADSPIEAFDLVNEDEVFRGVAVVKEWYATEIKTEEK